MVEWGSQFVNRSQASDEPSKFGAPVVPVHHKGETCTLFQRTDGAAAQGAQ